MVRFLFKSVWMLIAKGVIRLLASYALVKSFIKQSIWEPLFQQLLLFVPKDTQTHRSNLKCPCWPPSFLTRATDWLFCQIKRKTHLFLPGGSGQHAAYLGSCPLITAEEQYICSVCHSFMSYWLLKLSLQLSPRETAWGIGCICISHVFVCRILWKDCKLLTLCTKYNISKYTWQR